jgi:hypothetical protein
VLLQLVSKRSEDEAVGALRTLAASGDTLAAMHNPSAYLAHGELLLCSAASAIG